MNKNLLAIFCALCFSIRLMAQDDSLRIHIQGLCKGEKYEVYYNNILVSKIRCAKKRCDDYISIKLDSIMKEDSFLNIDIHRRGRYALFYRDTYFSPRYIKGKKYLVIRRNKKLKNRYALDYLWADEKIKYYD